MRLKFQRGRSPSENFQNGFNGICPKKVVQLAALLGFIASLDDFTGFSFMCFHNYEKSSFGDTLFDRARFCFCPFPLQNAWFWPSKWFFAVEFPTIHHSQKLVFIIIILLYEPCRKLNFKHFLYACISLQEKTALEILKIKRKWTKPYELNFRLHNSGSGTRIKMWKLREQFEFFE